MNGAVMTRSQVKPRSDQRHRPDLSLHRKRSPSKGLRTPVRLSLTPRMPDLAVSRPASHVGVAGVGGKQPAGDASGSCRQISGAWIGPAHRLLVSVGKLQNLWRCFGKFCWLSIGIQTSSCRWQAILHALRNFGVVIGQWLARDGDGKVDVHIVSVKWGGNR